MSQPPQPGNDPWRPPTGQPPYGQQPPPYGQQPPHGQPPGQQGQPGQGAPPPPPWQQQPQNQPQNQPTQNQPPYPGQNQQPPGPWQQPPNQPNQPGQQWGGPPARRAGLSATAKRLLIGGGVLLVVLVVAIASTIVWAMNRGVHTASGKLANASQFLTSRTSAWESGLPKEGITRADDSGCYFVMSDKNDQTAGDYACGPVLRPDVEKKNAWDLYKFSISGDQATNPQPGAGVSQGLPAGTYLADGNGSRQEFDVEGLKVPPYPRLAAGTVLPQGEFTVADPDKGAQVDVGGDARLVGLGKVFTVASVQEVSKASAKGGQVSQAAEGQKLYLLTLGPDVPAPNSLSGTNTLSLSVDDKETTLLGGSDTQVLFSAGDKASLVLDAAGQKQSLDLKNGVRQGNPRTEPLYSTNFPVSNDRSVTVDLSETRGPDGAPYDMTGKVTKVTVSPFLDGEWAPEGQIFVDVTMTNDAETTNPGGRTFTVECAASTVDGGKVTACGPGLTGGSLLTMTAPAGASATVHYAPTLKVTGGGKDPMDVSFAPKVVNVPLN